MIPTHNRPHEVIIEIEGKIVTVTAPMGFIPNRKKPFKTKLPHIQGVFLCMGLANERRRYIVTPPLIGWAHTQKDPWDPAGSQHREVDALVMGSFFSSYLKCIIRW